MGKHFGCGNKKFGCFPTNKQFFLKPTFLLRQQQFCWNNQNLIETKNHSQSTKIVSYVSNQYFFMTTKHLVVTWPTKIICYPQPTFAWDNKIFIKITKILLALQNIQLFLKQQK